MNTKGAALVTGAARRIGGVIAERLAREGYAVALHASARSRLRAEVRAEALRAGGAKACVVEGDLTRPEDVGRLVGAARAALGPVTVLVNNASLFEDDSAQPFDITAFDAHIATNLRAPLQLASDFARALPPDADGAIINIVDQRVWRLNPRFLSYTLSKAALWTATQTLAQALAPRIRVNAVGPGPTLPNTIDGQAGFAREAAALPLGRPVAASDVADAVLYLVGARSVTGQMIAVDSGQHLAWRTPDVEG